VDVEVEMVVLVGTLMGIALRSSEVLVNVVVVVGFNWPATDVEFTQTIVPCGFMILMNTFVPFTGTGRIDPVIVMVWEPLYWSLSVATATV
jgi:hypothetical protein